VSGGRCETCKGVGYQKMEMYFFEDLYIKCDECQGKRFRADALRILYKGKNIDDVLNMTVDEAIEIFQDIPKVVKQLLLMKDIGLGYLRLGQPATTLSGGEAQRLKICGEMLNTVSDLSLSERNLMSGEKKGHSSIKRDILYILDEPTIGLHFRDVQALIVVLRRLVHSGNTVIVIEHNLDVIRASDWIIDLGPEGGDRGGRIIFTGSPEDLIKIKGSYTGKYLKEHIYSHSPNKS